MMTMTVQRPAAAREREGGTRAAATNRRRPNARFVRRKRALGRTTGAVRPDERLGGGTKIQMSASHSRDSCGRAGERWAGYQSLLTAVMRTVDGSCSSK